VVRQGLPIAATGPVRPNGLRDENKITTGLNLKYSLKKVKNKQKFPTQGSNTLFSHSL
jgi:hypothetical protein